MANDTITGAAAVYGPTGTLLIFGTWTTSENKVQEVSLEQSVDKADFKIGGIVLGRRYYNVQHKCRVTIVPTGSTKALALANVKLPPLGSTVVLASTLGGGTNTLFDNSWTFDGDGSVNVSADGSSPVSIVMSLWRVQSATDPNSMTYFQATA